MAAINVPAAPSFRQATPQMVLFQNHIVPYMGGEEFKLLRMGSRFSLSITLPRLSPDQAREWLPILLLGDRDKLSVKWPQPKFDTGAPGSPLVTSATLANATTVPVKTLASGYLPKKGQFLNVVSGGIRFLHIITDYAALAGTTGNLSVWPPTRKAFATNDVIELREPRIEGFPLGDSTSWTHELACTVGIAFAVREAR